MFLFNVWFFSLVKSPWLHQLMPGVASGFPLAGIASRRRSRDIIRGEETKMKLSWMLMNLIWELFLIDHSTVPKCYIHFGVLVSSCPRFCFERIQKKGVCTVWMSFLWIFFPHSLNKSKLMKKAESYISYTLPSCCCSSLLQRFPFFKMGLFMALAEGLDCNATTWKSRRLAEDEWPTVMIYCTLIHFAWYAVFKSHQISKEDQSRHASDA